MRAGFAVKPSELIPAHVLFATALRLLGIRFLALAFALGTSGAIDQKLVFAGNGIMFWAD